MTGFVLRAVIAAFGLWLASSWVDGIDIKDPTTLLLAAALDPLQPFVPALRWLVIVAGACTVACALLQLGAASNDRRWGARFALALMCTLLTSALLVAHGARGSEAPRENGTQAVARAQLPAAAMK